MSRYDYRKSDNKNGSWTISRKDCGSNGPSYVVAVVYGASEATIVLDALESVTSQESPRPCPHPNDCTAKGCAGTCDEAITSRMRPEAANSQSVPE